MGLLIHKLLPVHHLLPAGHLIEFLLPPHKLLLLSHLLIQAGSCVSSHIHIHKAESRAAAPFILGSHTHGTTGGIGHGAHGHRRIGKSLAHLHFLNLRFILLIGLDTVNAEGHDFQTPELPPALGQHIIQGIGDFESPPRQLHIVNALGTQSGKGRLQRVQKLRLQLAVDLAAVKHTRCISDHTRIEKHRVHNVVAVFAEAAQADEQNLPRIGIFHFEGDFLRRTVLVAKDFLHVEIVDPLILSRVAAKGEPFLHLAPHIFYALLQGAGENGRFCGFVINVFPRFAAYIHHLAGLHYHHALAAVDGDFGTVGNNIVFSAGIGTAIMGTGPLLPLHHKNVGGHAVAVKKLLPLVGQYAAGGTHGCFDQTHNTYLLFTSLLIRNQ